jgi:hypothetical protein
MRKEFEQQLTDLRVQIGRCQSEFGEIRRDVLEVFGQRIRAAQTVSFEWDGSETHESRGPVSHWNRKMFSQYQSDNEELSRKLMKRRIVKCMSEISTFRCFKKRIGAARVDRKQACAQLWRVA